jgi:hypothetical protein
VRWVPGAVRRWWAAGRREQPGAPQARRLVVLTCLAAGAAAMVLAATATAPDDRAVTVRFAVVGLVLLVGTLARWRWLLTPALLGLAAAAVVPVRSGTDGENAAILLAGLLVATGELSGWAEDLRSIVGPPASELRRRAATVAASGAGAVLAAAGVLAVARLEAPGGALPVLLGAGATLLVLAFAGLRRWRSP